MKKYLHNSTDLVNSLLQGVLSWTLVTVLTFALSSVGFAQQVMDLDEALSTMTSSTDKSVNQKSIAINSLLFDLQPTIYLSDGEVNQVAKQTPIRITSDVKSIPLVNTEQFSSAKVLVINVANEKDLKRANLSGFNHLKSLEYIYFQIGFQPKNKDLVKNQIQTQLGQTLNSKVKVFYTISPAN